MFSRSLSVISFASKRRGFVPLIIKSSYTSGIDDMGSMDDLIQEKMKSREKKMRIAKNAKIGSGNKKRSSVLPAPFARRHTAERDQALAEDSDLNNEDIMKQVEDLEKNHLKKYKPKVDTKNIIVDYDVERIDEGARSGDEDEEELAEELNFKEPAFSISQYADALSVCIYSYLQISISLLIIGIWNFNLFGGILFLFTFFFCFYFLVCLL